MFSKCSASQYFASAFDLFAFIVGDMEERFVLISGTACSRPGRKKRRWAKTLGMMPMVSPQQIPAPSWTVAPSAPLTGVPLASCIIGESAVRAHAVAGWSWSQSSLSQSNHKGCKPCGPFCSGLLDLISPKLNAHPLADRLNAYGACHRSYKGSALALLVEILGGALAGGAVEAKAAARNWGSLVAAVDPAVLGDSAAFRARVSALLHRVKAARRAPGVSKIRLPGESSAELAGAPLIFPSSFSTLCPVLDKCLEGALFSLVA